VWCVSGFNVLLISHLLPRCLSLTLNSVERVNSWTAIHPAVLCRYHRMGFAIVIVKSSKCAVIVVTALVLYMSFAALLTYSVDCFA